MDPRTAAGAYREAAFENAPPIKIVRMLYSGALRFLDQAAAEPAGGLGSRYAYLLMRADSIVAELRLALLKEHAPDVAANLEQLYLFVEDRLRAAMREQNKAHISDARKVLANLLEAWSQVELTSRAS
ncbi:MAG: flagellar export chaperone FliS [Planctomycetes bacterium]|nr:flagellar export chaperone FliS [Planctomycetota bacterium]